jgi:hypothetical protein
MKKEKYYIELVLRMFKADVVSIEEATKDILDMYKRSWVFNYQNFSLGFYLGVIIASTLIKFFTKS